MTPIHRIPLDAWVIILRYIDKQRLVQTFYHLFNSNVFAIPLKNRTDTFWIVVSQARHLDRLEEALPSPDSSVVRRYFAHLTDMGVPAEQASDILRRSEGDFDFALDLLGW